MSDIKFIKLFFLKWVNTICLILVIFPFSVSCQLHHEILLRQSNAPINFHALQDTMNLHFADKFRGKGSGYKPWKRYEEWTRLHLNTDGTVGNSTYQSYQAIKAAENTNQPQSITINTGNWTSVGPVFNQGTATGIGRPNCIAFHPTNANIFYIGAPIGGVWRGDKTSGTTAWTPLSDGIAGLGVASIALHPSNPNIIFILTGDGNRADSYSTGMLVSYDAGYSWQETNLKFTRTDQQYGYKILINPQNANTMYVALRSGVMKTTNGGASWITVPVLPGCYDIEYKPADTTMMYAAGFGSLYTLNLASSTNWVNKSSYLPAGTRRVALAVSPADNQKVYVYCGNHDSILVAGNYISAFKGILRSDNSGSTYTLVCNNPNISGYNQDGSDRAREQSDTDMDIAVSPTNASIVYAGTENVWRSSNAGLSFGANATSYWSTGGGNYVHEDINFISINPADGSVYCGSDGGLYRTTNSGVNWVDMGYGLVISQFYRIAVQQKNTNIIVNGAQDAAANVRVGATAEFKEVSGGDGMDCMIDEQDDQVLYTTYPNGVLYRSLDGGATTTKINGTLTGNWITPLAMDYYKSDTIYYGQIGFDATGNVTSEAVYRSFNKGSNWTTIGGVGSEALAIGISNTNRLYGYGRKILQTCINAANASPSWVSAMGVNYPSQITLTNSPITKISVNPANDQEVWFSMGGYDSNNKVFGSTDAGAHWTNYSPGLPNVAILSIAYGNNIGLFAGGVYIGTDVGVFYRSDALGGWIPFRNWLPAVPVWDLKINFFANLIRAGTYGRGIWESSLYTGCASTLALSTYLEGYHYYQTSNNITSQSTILFGNGNNVNFKAGNYIQLTPGFDAGNGSFFDASIGPCGAGIPNHPASGDTFNLKLKNDIIPAPIKFVRRVPNNTDDPKKLPSKSKEEDKKNEMER